MTEDLKTTAGELKKQLADIPDDAPLLILYDSQAGVSTGIEVLPDLDAEYEKIRAKQMRLGV